MGSQRVGHDWVTELNWTESLQQLGHLQMLNVLIFFSREKYAQSNLLLTSDTSKILLKNILGKIVIYSLSVMIHLVK